MTRKTLATPKELAEYLGIPETTLRDWRYRGRGPRFIKCGPQHVRYDWADVEAWLKSNRQEVA